MPLSWARAGLFLSGARPHTIMSSDPERAADASNDDLESVEDVEDENAETNDITRQVLRQADVLAAIQGQLRQEMLNSMPPQVKRRIKALKKLQLETTNIESKFYEEVHALECKYHKLYQPLYTKRANVICGLHEPTDEEIAGMSDDEKDDELCAEIKAKVKIEDLLPPKDQKAKEEAENNKNKDISGIPEFWLTIFKNVALLSEMVEEHDEPILKHLIDIQVILLDKNPMGFVLEFHFSPNEYFSNSVLSKEYEMKCTPDETDPFSFEGPEIYKCKGCIIDWYKGKNVTVKTIKKKQKHKSRGSIRTVQLSVQNDSFFNFFNPPMLSDDPEAELDDDTQTLLTSDFEIGHYIRERIVPRAVLYFTGEALEAEEDYEEDDSEEEDEEEEDEDEDYNPNANQAVKKALLQGQNPQGDCKQQ
ncbi:nucleosome assembly protein 1-like 1-B [Thrips palmi]|uniref:Nucleosome assembly protein 1-like 1-B n=1 Tax=Thrips palmi TaxID=161013 RepID=A0A6P8ZA96_THRPL|nr:nucleosome assembly protein 1-like 1-B [Thrips palmi]